LLKWLPAEQRADLIDLLLSEPAVVDTPHGKIRFLNHSGAGYWRARAIMTKEPGSLEWIDSMVPGSVFWDIGANIGVLTLYAAMRGDLKGGALLHLQRKQEAGSKPGEFPIIELFRAALSMSSSHAMAGPAQTT